MLPPKPLSGLRRALAALAFALIAALLAVGAPSGAAAQTVPQKLPGEIVRDLDIQSDLPKDEEPPNEWQWRLHFPPELVWLLVVIGILLAALALKDSLPAFFGARGGGGWDEAAAGAGEHDPEAAAAAAIAADDLARQGRFAEAMHVLLLQSLGDIRRRLDERFADSLTSREILRSIRLSDLGRAALRDIVARVERTYFGAYPASGDDYQACRTDFVHLTEAQGGPAIA